MPHRHHHEPSHASDHHAHHEHQTHHAHPAHHRREYHAQLRVENARIPLAAPNFWGWDNAAHQTPQPVHSRRQTTASLQPQQNAWGSNSFSGFAGSLAAAATSLVGELSGNPAAFEQNHINRRHAWCAEFVNAALRKEGKPGTGSAVAASFFNYGTPVAPNNVQAGDIYVRKNHVGVVTGVLGNGQVEIAQGNYSHRAAISVESVRSGQFRHPSV
jgi:hypothetical protein